MNDIRIAPRSESNITNQHGNEVHSIRTSQLRFRSWHLSIDSSLPGSSRVAALLADQAMTGTHWCEMTKPMQPPRAALIETVKNSLKIAFFV